MNVFALLCRAQSWFVDVSESRPLYMHCQVCEAIVRVDQAFQKHQLKLFYKVCDTC